MQLTKETKINFKRSEIYYIAPETPDPTIANHILEFGEPLYLKDINAIVIGDGIYEDEQFHKGELKGSTVKELIEGNKYFKIVNNPTLTQVTLQDNKDASGSTYICRYDTIINNIYEPETEYNTQIANVTYVQNTGNYYYNKINDRLNTEQFNISNNQTIKSISSKVDTEAGKNFISIEKQPIDISYTQINNAAPSSIQPLENKESPEIGTSTNWARQDHIHPRDSYKADKLKTVYDIKYENKELKLKLGGTENQYGKVIDNTEYTKIVDTNTLKQDMDLTSVSSELVKNKAEKSETVSDIKYESNYFKFKKITDSSYTNIIDANTLKSDMNLNNVTNESKSTMFTNPTFTGNTIINAANFNNTPTVNYQALITESQVNTKIANEKNERTSADNNLSSRIDNILSGATQIKDQNISNSLKLKGISVATTTDVTNAIKGITPTNISDTSKYDIVAYKSGFYKSTDVYIQNKVIYGAAWNDIAEFRKCKENIPGTVVIEDGNGNLIKSNKKFQKGYIISDTYGLAIGDQEDSKPVAIAGRVLATIEKYPHEYKLNQPVTSGKNGGIIPMNKLQAILNPDKIIGYVSEIPKKEDNWNGVNINNRIWIRL